MAKVSLTKREPTHLQIANRAFEIYVSRGGEHARVVDARRQPGDRAAAVFGNRHGVRWHHQKCTGGPLAARKPWESVRTSRSSDFTNRLVCVRTFAVKSAGAGETAGSSRSSEERRDSITLSERRTRGVQRRGTWGRLGPAFYYPLS